MSGLNAHERVRSGSGELGIDPGEAVEERLAKLGVGAEERRVDGEETEQFVAGLGTAPEVGEEPSSLVKQTRLGKSGG